MTTSPKGEAMITPITVAEIKNMAEQKLPEQVWDYYVTGADSEQTLRRNEAVYNQCVCH
jgi:(S)-2-hydroxy-acid oxidase